LTPRHTGFRFRSLAGPPCRMHLRREPEHRAGRWDSPAVPAPQLYQPMHHQANPPCQPGSARASEAGHAQELEPVWGRGCDHGVEEAGQCRWGGPRQLLKLGRRAVKCHQQPLCKPHSGRIVVCMSSKGCKHHGCGAQQDLTKREEGTISLLLAAHRGTCRWCLLQAHLSCRTQLPEEP
jgi:hypothetical protein